MSRPLTFNGVLGVGGGSLGSSVSYGLSSSVLSTRRPGSLVIGASPMSKSSSEPMNLITDTVDISPVAGQTECICMMTILLFRVRSKNNTKQGIQYPIILGDAIA